MLRLHEECYSESSLHVRTVVGSRRWLLTEHRECRYRLALKLAIAYYTLRPVTKEGNWARVNELITYFNQDTDPLATFCSVLENTLELRT